MWLVFQKNYSGDKVKEPFGDYVNHGKEASLEAELLGKK